MSAGETLTINTGSTVTNTGTFEALANSALAIEDSTITNTNGTIEAAGANAAIELFGATIDGGKLEASHGGIIEAPNGATFVGVTLDGGRFETNDGFSIDLQDTTTIDGQVKFKGGGGTFELDGFDAKIVGTSGTDATLDNHSTIAGAGTIGGDGLSLDNKSAGTIDANVTGGTLTIDTGNTVTNAGHLEATGGGVLTISDSVTNTGTLEAITGGSLDVAQSVDNTDGLIYVGAGTSNADFAGVVTGGNATISGGALEFGSASSVDVTFDNGTGATPRYGVLALGDAADFSGDISGFAGTGASLSQSDAIDLAGFKINRTTFTATYDSSDNTTSVTVTDSHDDLSASLTFDGDYATSLVLKGDGNGGTYIFDPPANSSGTSSSVGHDNFVFHPNLGAGAGNSEPLAGPHDFGQFTAAEIQQWLAGSEPAGAPPADVTAQIDAHWHHALQNAVHLH